MAYFYGIDSDTAVFPSGAPTHDFYVGRRGYGTNANTTYWNTAGASLANRKYMYWGITGPKSDPDYNASPATYTAARAYAWGQSQGVSAYYARTSTSAVNTQTIFADIESGFGGYFTTDTTPHGDSAKTIHQQVFKGFCDKIRALGYVPGVYTSSGDWNTLIGSPHSPLIEADVLWGANWPAGSTFNNPPTSLNNVVWIGGAKPTIWQYYGVTTSHNPAVTGDANIASSLPS